MAPRQLIRLLWGTAEAHLYVDPDRWISADNISRLNSLSGLSTCDLEALTLKSFAGKLFDATGVEQGDRWILNQGQLGHVRVRHGQQACTACLRDLNGYYRQEWRLAFATSCPLHRRILIDRCCHCEAHLTPLRGSAKMTALWRCWHCRRDLDDTILRLPDPSAVALQALCSNVAATGLYRAPKQDIDGPHFFQCLEAVTRRLSTNRGAIGLVRHSEADPLGGRIKMRFSGHRYRLISLPPWARQEIFALTYEWLKSQDRWWELPSAPAGAAARRRQLIRPYRPPLVIRRRILRYEREARGADVPVSPIGNPPAPHAPRPISRR